MDNQPITCKLCGYKLSIGEFITEHLIDKHFRTFLIVWFAYSTKDVSDEIYKFFFKYEGNKYIE